MIWTLLALLLMAVAGGFISYFGDLQGRRWGKKRVSLFKLRPKHTAILLTSLTGSAISLLSVGAILLVVPQLRDIILQGEDAIRQTKIQKRELDAVNETLKDNRIKALASETFSAKERALADKERITFDALKKTNLTFVNQNMSLQKDNYRQQAENRLLLAQSQKLSSENKAIEKQSINTGFINEGLDKRNAELAREAIRLEKQKKELNVKIATLEASGEKLNATNEELIKTRDQLLEKTNQLAKYNSTLQASFTQLVDENREQAQKVQTQIASLNRELAELTAQRNLLNSERRDLVQNYFQQLHGRYSLLSEGELSRTTIEAHSRPEAVRTQLKELLNRASLKAQRYGATLAENGRYVYIATKRVVTASNINNLDEDASLEALVENITGSLLPVVVVAQVVTNSIAGEPVQVDLRSYASRTVFKKGEKIAGKTIDARGDIEQIIASLTEFLKDDVRTAAVRAGTIPLVNPDTGEVVVGALGPAPILALADRIKRLGGLVELNAIASDLITSADQLSSGATSGSQNVRFDVRRAPAPSNR